MTPGLVEGLNWAAGGFALGIGVMAVHFTPLAWILFPSAAVNFWFANKIRAVREGARD